MKNRWEKCKGCVALNINEECGLNLYTEEDISTCPCQECVVKVMCRDQCYKLRQYMKTARVDRTYIRRMIKEARLSLKGQQS